MIERKTLTTFLGLALALGVIWVRSCPAPRLADEEALPAASPAETTKPSGPVRTEPPQPDEVRTVVARVFAGALHVERRPAPAGIAGDFNGDGWPDLAVAGRPAENRLGELGGELANWILEDPRGPRSRPADVRVEANDALLAIVHGHGPEGWRSDEARQAYLLRGAFARLESRPLDKARPASHSRSVARSRKDALVGTLAGRRGFLLWSGARYSWHHGRLDDADDAGGP